MAKKTAPKFQSRIKLNLLYPQGINQKITVLFIKWLIAYGRYIVVLVEIVVLVTFVVRFKYDGDLADLKEQIKSRVPYLQSLSTDETLIRNTQQKLSLIKKDYALNADWQKTLLQTANDIPTTAKLASLSLDHIENSSGITFRATGTTSSNEALAQFLTNLKNDPNFQDIDLASISFDQGLISFSIIGATSNMKQ